MTNKVLYLTNNENALSLYEWLKERCEVTLCKEPLRLEQILENKPDLIVSYNYSYIIKEDVIDYMQGRILNLHISYLPWNRGSSPNIWSFIDDTPKGVTIHQVSKGLDLGNIVCQKELYFCNEKETFSSTYQKLQETIVELFKDNWENIKNNNYQLIPQEGEGTYHTKKDLEHLMEQVPFEWSDNIADYLERFKMSRKGE